MKSFKNSIEILSNNSSENEPIFDGIREGEARIENQENVDTAKSKDVEKYIIAKADDAILTMRENLEIERKKGISWEKLIAKGAVGFAVVAALMSSPQFESEAMAAEGDNVKNEHILNEGDGISDETTEKLNQEFADFADKDLAERRKDLYLSNTEYAPEEDGETVSSIVLSKDGVAVNFSGNLENMGKIPAAFIDNLKEIKDNPYKFISDQVLNVLVINDAKKSAEDYIDENAIGGSHLSY